MGGTCTMAQWAARGQPTLASNDKICSLSTYTSQPHGMRDELGSEEKRALPPLLAPSCATSRVLACPLAEHSNHPKFETFK
jgi:hypothetical protein